MTWLRVSRSHPCAVCGKTDWCAYTSDGGLANCPRTPSDRLAGDSGYIHVVDRSALAKWPPPGYVEPPPPEMPKHNPAMAKLSAGHRQAIGKTTLLAKWAEDLGVSKDALVDLGTGVQMGGYGSGSMSFPMSRFKVGTVGIRYRSEDGRKWAETGSRQGLFIPTLPTGKSGIFFLEGPTDTASALTLGFPAIGRPSAMGCYRMAMEAIVGRHIGSVVIWADNDSSRVGFNGAGELARIVFESGWRGRLDVVQPPPDVKDFRKWVNCGATRQDVLARVEAARSGRITAGATS